MIDTHFKKVVDKYSDIVKSIGKLEISEEEQISKLKAKLSLLMEQSCGLERYGQKRRFKHIVITGCDPTRV